MAEEVLEIKKKTKRTPNWSSSEVILFIDLCKEEKVLQKMDGKRFRWAEVMLPIKTKMEQENFFRDVNQLTNKLKTLRTDYRKALDQNHKSGEAPSKFPYYSQMEELLGSRPRNIFPLLCGKEVISINGNSTKYFLHFWTN